MQRTVWIIIAVVVLAGGLGGWIWSQQAEAPRVSAPKIQGPSGPPSVVGPGEPPPEPVAARSITVEGDEFSFNPKEIRVKPGAQITLTFKNVGRAPHTFTIPELNLDSGIVPSGAEFRLTFVAPDAAITYQSVCTVPGHKEAGMVGKLTVE